MMNRSEIQKHEEAALRGIELVEKAFGGDLEAQIDLMLAAKLFIEGREGRLGITD